jgi:hypothetical protein
MDTNIDEDRRRKIEDRRRPGLSLLAGFGAGFGMQGAHGTNLPGCLLLESSV